VWLTPNKKKTKAMDKVTNYVVYCFAPGEKINLENSSNIVAITPNTFYHLPKGLSGKYTYVVTSLDRTQNESKGKKLKVKF
jgi:fibronectin type 3 domain-containing protein